MKWGSNQISAAELRSLAPIALPPVSNPLAFPSDYLGRRLLGRLPASRRLRTGRRSAASW
eukprot:549487-Hanusia_phi.AAC.4